MNRFSRRQTFAILSLVFVCFLGTKKAFSEETGFFRILRGSIPEITWKRQPLELKIRANVHGRPEYYVVLEGTFKGRNSDLLWGGQKVVSADEENVDFTEKVVLRGPKTKVSIRVVDVKGRVQRQVLGIFFPEFGTAQKSLGKKHFYFSPSIGVSQIVYREGTTFAVDTTVLSAKLGLGYRFIPGVFDFAVAGYATIVPLLSNVSQQVRFLGLNFRLGYRLFGDQRFSMMLMAGAYYTTMFVDGQAFGFRNMLGPQLFPVFRYQWTRRESFVLYLKYSPILAERGLRAFSDREIASGLTYAYSYVSGNSFSLSLDVAQITLNISSVEINSTSFSLSAGYQF